MTQQYDRCTLIVQDDTEHAGLVRVGIADANGKRYRWLQSMYSYGQAMAVGHVVATAVDAVGWLPPQAMDDIACTVADAIVARHHQSRRSGRER